MYLLSKLAGLERLLRAQARSSNQPGARKFPKKGKPLRMIESYQDGTLMTTGRPRELITESMEELEKKYSLIIVKLKNKPDDRPA